MICPRCSKNILSNQMVKRNVRGFDSIDLVYDLTCPFCSVRIGRMFWGEMMPEEATVKAQEQRRKLDEPGEEDGKAKGQEATMAAEPTEIKIVHHICPHCGGDLPEHAEELPVKREGADRRKRDRRQDYRNRRKNRFRWFGMDRRKADRRKGDRRLGTDRRQENVFEIHAEAVEQQDAEKRHGERRKLNRPVLYDRRRMRDRRIRAGQEKKDWKA